MNVCSLKLAIRSVHAAMGACVLLTAIPAAALAGPVLYVDAAAGPGGTGASWGTAFNDLQPALAAASGDGVTDIWVAKGVYKPAAAGGSRAATFQLVNNIRVLGGFAGTETLASQADPVANLTVLSGDLNGDDVPGFGNRHADEVW